MHCAVDVYSQKQGIHFHPQGIQEKPVQFYTHHFAVRLRYELLLKFHPVVLSPAKWRHVFLPSQFPAGFW